LWREIIAGASGKLEQVRGNGYRGFGEMASSVGTFNAAAVQAGVLGGGPFDKMVESLADLVDINRDILGELEDGTGAVYT
jgi:hypothetical protein